MKLYLSPTPQDAGDSNGVGRVVKAQYDYLPHYGIEFVSKPEQADIVAAHITADHLPRLDVLHCHGLYWTADEGEWSKWHHEANWRIGQAARKARAITVPSEWVAMPFKRDMRINPHVIGHGIDLDEWERGENRGHVLWNKNRMSSTCDPTPAVELFKRGVPVVSTFGTPDMNPTGPLPFNEMKRLIQTAGVYLSTAKETFGIGTLEAMACGVPVLGYAWGGNLDIVTHWDDGYLARPGDIDDLYKGYQYIMENYGGISTQARLKALAFKWDGVIEDYASLYYSLYHQKEESGVCVVITNYNYGRYVGEAIESVLNQTRPVDEIIVVDDGSTDNSLEIIGRYPVKLISQQNQGVAMARNKAIQATNQPYVICLDADDKLAPEYVATLTPFMEASRQFGVVYSGLTLFKDDGSIQHTDWPPPFSFETQSNVAVPPSNCIPSAAMFRREMWERAGGIIQQGTTPAEDVEFWTRGLSYGFEAAKVTNKPLFWYRLHGTQAHRTKQYKRIDSYLPWMRDKQYPLAAPVLHSVPIRSYSDPLISVIIPVGPGHDKHIHMALESLAGQSVRNWEAVVVNDTGQPLETLPFARVIDCKGRSAGAARNVGLEHAKAPLVYFLDADDYLLPEALAVILQAFIEHNGDRYIYTNYYDETATGKRIIQRMHEYNQHNWQGQHPVNVLMWKEDALRVGGFDPSLVSWEDWDFQARLQINGICGAYVPIPTFIYRTAEGQRREESVGKEFALLPILKERYGKYFNGGLKKMACGTCGGSKAAAVILKAKRSLTPLVAEAAARVNGESTMIRMEYTGENPGAIAFQRIGGVNLTKVYRGGNNPNNRYADAAPEDVALLESTGKWRQVRKVAPVAISEPLTVNVEETPAPAPPEDVTKEATQQAIEEAEAAGLDWTTLDGRESDGKVLVSHVRAAIAEREG